MLNNLLLNNLLVIPASRDDLRAGDGRAYVAFYGARNGKIFDSWSSSFMAPERAMRLRDRIVRRHRRHLEKRTEGEVDKFTERDEAQLIKPQPPSVKAGCFDI